MIGEDKILHFWVSFFIALVHPAIAVVAGVGKEIWDAAMGGMADAGDLFADGLGILAAGLFRPTGLW
ncbi:MAG: hypothetical protein AMXMBFR84_19520 [Candidatus Hydrogenedentota bacterium]